MEVLNRRRPRCAFSENSRIRSEKFRRCLNFIDIIEIENELYGFPAFQEMVISACCGIICVFAFGVHFDLAMLS